MEKKSIVLICSGGIDSTTALYVAKNKRYQVHSMSFDYGQLHRKEIDCAKWHCNYLKVPHQIMQLSGAKDLWENHSALTSSGKVPHGHYNQEDMKLTVVPNRNMLMISYAIAKAITVKADEVWFGAHSGDHTIYPDCRPAFIQAMDNAAKLADWHQVSVVAPFAAVDKTQIVKIGVSLQIDYSQTWTCYQGEELACAKCGACTERLEAFRDNGIVDKLRYKLGT